MPTDANAYVVSGSCQSRRLDCRHPSCSCNSALILGSLVPMRYWCPASCMLQQSTAVWGRFSMVCHHGATVAQLAWT